MDLTITINRIKYTMPPVKMAIWRAIAKLQTEQQQSRERMVARLDELRTVDGDLVFEIGCNRVEISLAERQEKERRDMAELIADAFGGQFSWQQVIDELGDGVQPAFAALCYAVNDLMIRKGEEMPRSKKQSETNFEKMSPYQQVLHLYGLLHREWHWPREQIDAEEMEYIFDLFVAQAIGNQEPEVPIDKIL